MKWRRTCLFAEGTRIIYRRKKDFLHPERFFQDGSPGSGKHDGRKFSLNGPVFRFHLCGRGARGGLFPPF